MKILVLNCGSSSIKYQLINMDNDHAVLAKGLLERIGLEMGEFTHKYRKLLIQKIHNYESFKIRRYLGW